MFVDMFEDELVDMFEDMFEDTYLPIRSRAFSPYWPFSCFTLSL